MQGPQTDPRAIRMLGECVRAGHDIQVRWFSEASASMLPGAPFAHTHARIRLHASIHDTATTLQCCLLNYRKDGTRFWNYLFMSALHGPAGEVLYFMGVQSNIPSSIAKPLLEAQEAQFMARDITGPLTPSSGLSSSRAVLPIPLEQASDEFDPLEEAAIDALIVEHGGARQERPAVTNEIES
jgi:hypothetical protein